MRKNWTQEELKELINTYRQVHSKYIFIHLQT